MDQSNTQTTNNPEPQPVEQNPQPVVEQPVKAKKKFDMGKIMDMFKNIKSKKQDPTSPMPAQSAGKATQGQAHGSAPTGTHTEVPVVEEVKVEKKKKNIGPIVVKILVVVFVIIGAIYFINLFAPGAVQMLKDGNPLNGSPTPEATASPTPSPEVVPSKYANDPDILEIESQIKELEKGLNSIEFTDDNLHIPLLEWDVNFE